MMRQVSRPVRWGAGRKGRQDLARSLPGFKVLGVPFLGEVSSAFLPSKKACWAHQFRYLGGWPTVSEGLHPYIRWTKTPDFVHVYCGISPMSRVFFLTSAVRLVYATQARRVFQRGQ